MKPVFLPRRDVTRKVVRPGGMLRKAAPLGASLPSWPLAGGIDPAILYVAFQAKGAASYEASLVALNAPALFAQAEPYNLVPGGAPPAWTAETGWTFTGTEWLQSAAQGLPAAPCSVIARFSTVTARAGCHILTGTDAAYSPATGAFTLTQDAASILVNAHNTGVIVSFPHVYPGPSTTFGMNVSSANSKGYEDGVFTSTGTYRYLPLTARAIIGKTFVGTIEAMAFYTAALTPEQHAAVAAELANL